MRGQRKGNISNLKKDEDEVKNQGGGQELREGQRKGS